MGKAYIYIYTEEVLCEASCDIIRTEEQSGNTAGNKEAYGQSTSESRVSGITVCVLREHTSVMDPGLAP